jgi:hypothetical protein
VAYMQLRVRWGRASDDAVPLPEDISEVQPDIAAAMALIRSRFPEAVFGGGWSDVNRKTSLRQRMAAWKDADSKRLGDQPIARIMDMR